ncbi:MAG TPA: ABC transporter permease [Acidimicrobiales bacterium]|nr:ABC transporter permease [Acidimicrobiales bacterium]
MIESVRLALQGIMSNRLRSALTMLGILIGVAAVIILIAVGAGSSAAVQNQLSGLGTNTLTIFPTGGFGPPGAANRTGTQSRRAALTAKDVTALEDKTNAPNIIEVAPVVNAQGATATYNGATHQIEQGVGTTPNYFGIRNLEVASGSAFTQDDVDQHRKVVVLGPTVVTDLFGDGVDPVGQKIKIGGSTWTVIGVLKSKGSNGFADQDDIAIAPVTSVQDSLASRTAGYNNITVQAKSRKASDAASSEITSTLLSTHKVTTADFQVLNQAALLDASAASNEVFTVLLGAVAAISLLVGGIGVMNIMLVTVTERTREIGIRKAIGARKRHILSQFLVESVLLSMLGGLIGVFVGLAGSHFRIVGVTPVVQLYSVILAFGVAVMVGLFFGIYPANRAASLRPIEALRYE